MSKRRPTNKNLIQKYLNFYQHSPQSVKMRESSLKYLHRRTNNLEADWALPTFGFVVK